MPIRGLVLALIACVLPATLVAADTSVGVEPIYFALARGDQDRAQAASAALLARPGAPRAEALQARLDVLGTYGRLNQREGEELHAAIDAHAAAHAAGAALTVRFAIAAAWERNDPRGALALAQARLAQAPAAEWPELDVLVARTAANVPGQLPLAREHAERALATWHVRRGARARWLECELDYIIGNVYYYTGSSARALARFEAGARVAIAAFGDDSHERFRLDAQRAGVLGDLGRQPEALAIREALLTVARRRYGEASVEAAKAEGLIGATLQEIGDYAAARGRYEHAQQVMAAAGGASSNERGVLAANFGNLLQEMGEADAALAQYRQALALFGEGDATMHVRAVVQANMGNTEVRLGRYAAAIADFERALALREQADGKDSPGLAYSLEGLGSASLALHRYADAEAHFRRALALRERAVQPNHPSVGPLRFGLALARWGQGDADEAFRLAAETARHQQELLGSFATDFSERQSVAYRQLLVPATALAVTLAAARGDAATVAEAWRLTMVERGLVARAQAHRLLAARSRKDAAAAQAFAAWREANRTLGEAWLDKATAPQRLAELKAEAERAERALWHGAERAPADAGAGDAGALARALPADSALVAYTEGVAAEPARALTAGGGSPPEDWYAFVLGPDAQPALRRIGSIAALSAQARAWYADLRDPTTVAARLTADGAALRAALLDAALAGARPKHLFIVPEGELFRVSFAALPAHAGGYLVEQGVSVHTLAHEVDLAAPATSSRGGSTLLAGAPEFPALPAATPLAARQICVRAAAEGFAAIPNARRELEDLRDVFAVSPTAVTLLDGANATKDAVLAALPNARIAHIATHGFSLDASCSETGSRGVSLGTTADEAGEIALSGLAFNGARVGGTAPAIGVLSAGELAGLDLSRLDWIALSACDSGLGPIGRNEGVFGMRRALRLAGAHTVVMSLWQVDDAATAELMRALYQARFADGAPVPDAMAAAMRSVLAARRAAGASDHPYYWAAFVSEGAWR